MNDEHINPKYKKEILRAIDYHFPVLKKIYLFGSRARKTHKEGADVDVAIDAGKKMPPREIMRARVTLEHLPIPITVDLIDFHAVPDILQKIIIEEGILWKS